MTVDQQQVLDALRPLCAEVMSVSLERVVASARLVADLGADSLDLTELEVAIEATFGVRPEASQVRGVATVEDVVHLIMGLRAGSQSSVVV
ncbi:phosphopantetheine-binding protein [Streptomyces sp. NPDC002838]|uniref:acyl carrier protein n=1 Tax=Streptomyces sp. NPDC002838 TaxID=3154436 RepID=UPI003331F8CF